MRHNRAEQIRFRIPHAASHAIQRAFTPELTRRNGWAIYDNGPDHHPRTGRFRAWRAGVSIGSGTLAGVIGIIDTRPTW